MRIIKSLSLVGLTFGLPFLCSCSSSNYAKGVASGFDTFWEITLFDGNESSCQDIKKIIGDLSGILDPYQAHIANNLYRLNCDKEVAYSKDLYDVLSFAVSLQEMTEGSFNPFLLNLNDAWKKSLEEGKALSEEVISDYLLEAAGTSLSFEENKIRLLGDGKVDLGAIGKGFCLDRIKGYLQSKSISAYRIDGGMSSILLGSTGSDSVKEFTATMVDYPSYPFKVKECGISTSSISEQKFDIGGLTYSHIVNPHTGSALPEYQMVLLSGTPRFTYPNAALDALTTAFFSLSKEEIVSTSAELGLDYAYLDMAGNFATNLKRAS